MKKLLLLLSVIIMLASCAMVDSEHVVVKIPHGADYRVRRGTIVHKDNGCISFKSQCGECAEGTEQTITVCGNYSIIE